MPTIPHLIANPCLPYIVNASVTETRPHYKAGSNVLASIKGLIEKRPGHAAYTNDLFGGPIQRLFGWRLWGGAFFVMADVVSGGQSFVSKLKIGTDVSFALQFTSSVAVAFDFVTSNNVVYFGNGTDMKKYDGTTVTNWGIAKPAAAPTPTQSGGAGSISAAAGGYSYKYAFGNSTTGHVGQISDASAYTGNFTSKNYTITGSTTADTQVDKVHIYRTADGGAIYYELPNSPINYSIGWSVVDSAVSSALNTAAQASLPSMNAPPPGSQGCTFFAGRIWTFSGDTVYYSNFEENINGVAAEAFNTINKYPMGAEVTGLSVCQKSLLIFTRSTIQRITGDSLTTFSRQPFINRAGVDHMTNIANGGQRVVAWIDTTSTVWITDGITSQEIGLPIRTDIAAMDQTKTSMTFHSDGIRQWLLLQDSGQNKSWVYDNDLGQWMVPWSIGGTAIHSCETSQGVYTLLRTTSSGTVVLKMTPASYQDNGASYSETVTTSLVELGQGKGPGEVSAPQFIAIERNTVALSDVGIAYDDDPSQATFTSIFANETDPPDRTQGSFLIQKWYQFMGSTAQKTAQRAALKLTWPTATNAWQLYTIDTVSQPMEDIFDNA